MILLIAMIAIAFYAVPGLALARGMYSEQVREIRSKPVVIVPPKPPRPRIKISEMLHVYKPKECAMLSGGRACDCSHRDEWIELKNQWQDWNEWENKYSYVDNGVDKEPSVSMFPIYLSVVVWPLVWSLVMLSMFIKGGADNIPDFREIERLEQINQISSEEF